MARDIVAVHVPTVSSEFAFSTLYVLFTFIVAFFTYYFYVYLHLLTCFPQLNIEIWVRERRPKLIKS